MGEEHTHGYENAYFRKILESITDAFFALDSEWRFTYLNSEAEKILDRERDELLGKSLWEVFPEAVNLKFYAEYQKAVREQTVTEFEEYCGSLETWFKVKAYPMQGGLSVYFRDATRQKQLEEELSKSEERLRAVLVQYASDTISIVDAEGTISYETPGVEEALGCKSENRVGKSLFEFIAPDDIERVSEEFARLLESGGVSPRLEVRLRVSDGSLRYLEATGNNLLDDPRVGGIVISFRDITERKTLEEELKHQTLHDSLTGLPNRAMFEEYLQQAHARLERREGYVAVLFLDLDNFKLVNDSLGHEMGDQLLISVARRLENLLRPSDTIARFGGDEFIAVLEDLASPNEAAHIAERMGRELQRVPFVLDSEEIFVTASVGITLTSSAQEQPANLLRQADLAMYEAKHSGKARYAIFDTYMYDPALRHLQLGSDLTRAVTNGEFRLHYQPKVSLNPGVGQQRGVLGSRAPIVPASTGRSKIVAMEALIRWEHPEYGLMLPEEFFPVAEEGNLAVTIDKWVLEETCRQTREWREQGLLGDPPLLVCVNLSAGQFKNEGLVENIGRTLRENELDPSLLGLEISELVTMQDTDSARSILRELKALGVKLLIDDFGIGYTPLSQLRNFQLDYLTIDHSFAEILKRDPGGTEIVSGVTNLAHALGLVVIGQGIETASQFALLRELGCDMAQGNYISKPLQPEAAGALLARDPSW